MISHTSQVSYKPNGLDEKIAFVLIFVPCIAVLLSFAVLAQLVGLRWKSWLPGAENMTNVFAGVKASVYTFMSHII
jgi:light-harvesting complex 1 beta chain